MKLIRNEKGFTLIELVIVLVILGILGAVAMLGYTDLSTQARDAALQGAFGAHASQLAIAVGLCRSLPDQATGTGICNPSAAPPDFAGDFVTNVYNAVGVTGAEIARGAYAPATGIFNLCSGSLNNGRFIEATYDDAATPQLQITAGPNDWTAGATCDAAA
jgi:prepilin-type N-terminal cleavage/methylation domain-containing protein